MPSDKDRLYVVLYVREGQPRMPNGEDAYHWALVTGPKHETSESRGHRFNVKEGWKRGDSSSNNSINGNSNSNNNADAASPTVTSSPSSAPPAAPQPPQWTWEYEHVEISMKPTSKQLVRVVIGKVADGARLARLLSRVPVVRRERAGWNCVEWVAEAVGVVLADRGGGQEDVGEENVGEEIGGKVKGKGKGEGGKGKGGSALGTRAEGWDAVREAAMRYVERKKAAHRFDGLGPPFDPAKAATWDMLTKTELVD